VLLHLELFPGLPERFFARPHAVPTLFLFVQAELCRAKEKSRNQKLLPEGFEDCAKIDDTIRGISRGGQKNI
jgi:hypothetical protein